MVFVDTSAWFALFVLTDPHHQRVRDWVAANSERVLTPDYCIDETLTLLLVRGEHSRAMEAGRELIERTIARVQFVSPEQVQRAWVVFQQRATAGWSFTDCTSFIVISDLRIPTAVTLDAHFRQFGIVVAP
jgi:predicted nucleic acid-binding protein